ncbi:hypothetical protein EDC94DRAFT_653757 [Helicostylum pulchrum]|nr:hypothetical protein EDC94DRAFT_653757 [Helicostylum pulchrum]
MSSWPFYEKKKTLCVSTVIAFSPPPNDDDRDLKTQYSRLADQLLTELLALNIILNQDDVTTDSEDTTTVLQNLATPVNNQLDQLRPNIGDINNIVQQIQDSNEEERLLQAQLGAQVRIFIQNEQTHLEALRQYENQHRQTIEKILLISIFQEKFLELNSNAYNIPTLDRLHITIYSNYATAIVQNVIIYLLNARLWVVRIFKGYFLHQQYPQQQQRQQQEAEPQQQQQPRLRRLPIMSLAVDGIISPRPFNEMVLRQENDEEVSDEKAVR